MNIVDLRRNSAIFNINQNPTEIMIHRTEKKKMGGYVDEIEQDVGPFVVRIFVANSSSPQKVTTLAGEKQVDRYFGLLADHQADIQAGTTVKDEFTVNNMKFLVKAVYPQIADNQIVSYQVELERVN
ncbi:hypothetical protein [Rummeliibacillus sp. POC4]|uniref:hypothetical protein n=1 Tax=Rummeliibacillus sp. POC4 TaxID=2305899 RepID=UPI000E66FED8|nr:hypothetical protein [Rummeliibacillus sp. POC4]RIJ63609.1 hypothetical protein D1606_14105 [Rummeliibacillus sp. POC4]